MSLFIIFAVAFELTCSRYPPHMIPGVDITLHTTATADKDARMLLTALGMPFQAGGNR